MSSFPTALSSFPTEPGPRDGPASTVRVLSGRSRHKQPREHVDASEASCPVYLLAARLVETQRRVHHFLDERHAVELDQLDVRLDTTIDGKADLPGPGKDLGILDRSLVANVVRTGGRVAFDHTEGVAVEVPGPVEPRVAGEPRDVDHERVAVPTSSRPPHPGVAGRLVLAVHVDRPHCALVLVDDQDLSGRLKNL